MNIQQTLWRFSFFLLVWFNFAVAPTFSQTITHVPLYTFDGDPSQLGVNYQADLFGFSVSGAGDVNGDGYADLIVGAYLDANNGPDSGSARVFSGGDGSVLYTFDGDSTGDFLGLSVSDAGDVNGDGYADLFVGAPYSDSNDTNSGTARVLSGVDGSILYDFDGDSARGVLGNSVSDAGDVNGDGVPDLIAGGRGGARVFSGIDGSVLYDLSVGVTFNVAASGAGDVNGDGFADLIVGARFDDNNGSSSGSARVFSGADGSVLYNFVGDSAMDFFGTSVSGAGDVNGDGFADLIVGATGDDNNGANSGSARVFSGVDGSVLYNFDGDSTGDLFGISVSGAGDVNDDGFDDLIVGSIFDDNNGSNSGSARLFSGIDGTVLYTFDGGAGNEFGRSVSGAGDVNGDGVADFIVGATRGGANLTGHARVFVSQITVPFILGDANRNGEVDFSDIPAFIQILQTGTFLDQADCNQDGVVTFADIPAFIAILQASYFCPRHLSIEAIG